MAGHELDSGRNSDTTTLALANLTESSDCVLSASLDPGFAPLNAMDAAAFQYVSEHQSVARRTQTIST